MNKLVKAGVTATPKLPRIRQDALSGVVADLAVLQANMMGGIRDLEGGGARTRRIENQIIKDEIGLTSQGDAILAARPDIELYREAAIVGIPGNGQRVATRATGGP